MHELKISSSATISRLYFHRTMSDWVLITGASTGLGRELAKVFARNGHNAALTARNGARLEELASELKARHGIRTRVVPADLSQPAAPREMFAALRDLPVSILVNNAGFGSQGAFATAEARLALEMVRVNVSALLELAHLFCGPMIERREGRILNVASTAAFQPGPLMAVYYASKAFVFSFSVALSEELRGSGVTVTALCPGFTRTEFHERAGIQRAARWLPMMDAGRVAEIGYRGLMQGKRVVIPGALNKISSAISRRLPAAFAARIAGKINQPAAY
jgi:hypothetical protein